MQGYIWVVGRSEQKSHASRLGKGEIVKTSVKLALQWWCNKRGKRQALYLACRIAEANPLGIFRLVRRLWLAAPKSS